LLRFPRRCLKKAFMNRTCTRSKRQLKCLPLKFCLPKPILMRHLIFLTRWQR